MDFVAFKVLLDDKYQWPCDYDFRFVVPAQQIEAFKTLFETYPMTSKVSKTGKYESFTIVINMSSSDQVVAIYEKASFIKGIVSL